MNENKLEQENYTCEQKYPVKVNGEFTYEKFEIIDVNKDKISDNEFFRMRHKEENRNNFGENLIEDDNNEDNKNQENEYDSIKIGEENNNEDNNEENKENNEENDEDNNDKDEEEEVNENDATIQ